MIETTVFSLHLEQAKFEYAKLQCIRANMLKVTARRTLCGENGR
jgi:hypothetical protein